MASRAACESSADARRVFVRANVTKQRSRLLGLPVVQDFRERPGAQFVQREACQLLRFLFGQSAAVNRAQKIVEQSLTCGRVVEDIADQCGLRRFLNEVSQTF